MTLYFPHTDPTECALVLDDKRVHKSLVATARVICAVLGKRGRRTTYYGGSPHPPLVQWASKSDRNTRWVIDHFIALGSEYKHRTGQTHPASGTNAGNYVEYAQGAPSPFVFIDETYSKARRLDFRGRKDVHHANRMFLRALWRDAYRPPKWTKRGEPPWADDSIPDPNHYGTIDKNLLTMRARYLIGGRRVGESGVINCPRCGDDLHWACVEDKNYVELHCEDLDCIHLEEIKK